jgi:hypothetical protein
MRNRELEHIAALLAQDGEAKTDGECLGDVWAFLEECGIDPNDFRSCTCSHRDPQPCPLCVVEQEAKAVAEALEEEPTGTQFLPGTVLRCRSLADYDCIFEFTVVKRTDKFVTLRYFNEDLKVAIRCGSDGREYCFPLGKHSMSPMLYAEPF